MNNDTNLENLVKGLNIIKEEFFKNKEELKFSIRKDVVAVELKSILNNNSDYINLKNAIQNYIKTLYNT